MRLVCPNCEAKYEVPDDAVPDTGRDVQCTNCGHSWFQMRGRTGASPFVAPASMEPVAAAVEPAAEPEPSPASKREEVAAAAPIEEPAAVEPDVVPEAVEDSVAEAAAPEPFEADHVAAPEGDASLDVAKAETATQNDVEGVTGSAPVPDPEPVVSSTPDPVVEAIARTDAADEVEPVTEPGVLDVVTAEAEALRPAEDAVGVAADATSEAISDIAPESVPESDLEAASEAISGDIPASAPDYAVDDSVLAILREEAEREANARRAEALESQTDLGIDAAMPRKGAAIAEADAKPAARRDLLPDVEEINSTLRPSEMQDDADAPDFVAPPPEAPRGFRSGFLSLMTVAILAAALYMVAPRLAVMVPALAGPLEGYVSIVDSLRLGLDGMMRSATVAISDG